MNWWLESPLLIVMVGITAIVVFGAMWLQSGHKLMMSLMLAAIAATLIAVLVERSIQTDREQVHATLHELAQHVEDNDLQGLLEHVHPSLNSVRRRAESEMDRYEFRRVSIKRNLEIKMFPEEQPPRAIAEFNVVVVVSRRSGTFNNQRAPRFVRLTFVKEGDEWLVSDFSHYPPDAGFRRSPPE